MAYNNEQPPPPVAGQAPNEPFYMRMTPMEMDVQLQTAELVFRNLLAGKRIPVSQHEDIQSWEKDTLGDEWSNANELQRQEIVKQVRADGENTPMWMESLAHMGDIAWEVFEAGETGERMRSLEVIDRTEVMEQLEDLKLKVAMSHFAKSGAGDQTHGFRACIGLFRICISDSELLDLMVSVLIDCVTDHEYNRDSLACLTVPAPPRERMAGDRDRGWSLLRNALDAFVVQAVGAVEETKKETGKDSDDDSLPDLEDSRHKSFSKDVAVRIAELLVLMRNAPAVKAQLKLVHEDAPADCWPEWPELRDIIPKAKQVCQDLNNAYKPSKSLTTLREMLLEGEAFIARERVPAYPPGERHEGGE